MRISCRANSGQALPESYLGNGYFRESVFNVTIGSEYAVLGIAVYKGIVCFLLVDDVSLPNWYPADLFSVVDSRIPANWFSALYPGNAAALGFLIGYRALIFDERHYDALLERDPEALEIFHREVRGPGSENLPRPD